MLRITLIKGDNGERHIEVDGEENCEAAVHITWFPEGENDKPRGKDRKNIEGRGRKEER